VAGETVLGSDLAFIPGGKGANQAVASAKLGVETILVGRVGDDAFGANLRSFLDRTGVNVEQVKVTENVATGTALIVVSESAENTIVVVPGANCRLTPIDIDAVPIAKGNVLVAQFEVPVASIEAFFAIGRSKGTRNILNPAPALTISRELLGLSDLIILNETELELLTGERVSLETGACICKKLRARSEQSVILTLGKEGVIAISGTETIRVKGLQVRAVDTTGAGDCFVGALASRLALGLNLGEAIFFANKAAAISVQRPGAGTSMPTAAEVGEFTSVA
jgi:ribokinase